MNRFEFSMNLSAQEYLQYYRGSVDKVFARCNGGTTIRFPALLLTPFVTTAGNLYGTWTPHADNQRHKFTCRSSRNEGRSRLFVFNGCK
jgi:hypothetical protein